MCGFAGFLEPGARGARPDEWREALARMGQPLAHRGPDDSGVWLDAAAGIGLSHRRLSVLDLSSAGHQPMASASGRHVIAFNGEIYNHLALRRELDRDGAAATPAEPDAATPRAARWRGHSDTETLLAGFDAWGIAATLARATGMFALAVWDREAHTLTLARDRMGEKPLYYGWQGSALLFGSELKALRPHPDFRAEIDRDALALFMRLGYIPAPFSIYRGIRKLPPGTLLALTGRDRGVTPTPYWSVRQVAESSEAGRAAGSEEDRLRELDRLLREAVAGQMLADVPLGAFLSGGIDSSTVAALMQAQSSRPVRTFAIGFREDGYDEAWHARAVAAHLGTLHTELYVTDEQARSVIPRLPAIYDEPFADSSQIPTFLVSELARRDVTVCLSGDGGDELFGGYTRYYWTAGVQRRARAIPAPLRRALARTLTAVPPPAWNRVFGHVRAALPGPWRYENPGDKLHKLAELISGRDARDAYLRAVSAWKQPDALVLGSREPLTALADPDGQARLADLESRFMYLDQTGYLPDDILVKVDRAAMAVSLETRVPLLDHRVVEFAWRLPLSMKMREGRGKWLLRRLLHRYVPERLVERPKMGFTVPLDAWLRGALRNWAEALLEPARLAREGWLAPEPVRASWDEHLLGRRNRCAELWNVLMFQAWLETWHGRPR